MHKAKIPFTIQGVNSLKEELLGLGKRREATVLRLQAAREQGDLSENGAYKAARFELSDVDRRLRKINQLLADAIVTEARGDGRVGFGNRVTVESGGKLSEYLLVTQNESDPNTGKLSLESPLGQAIMGRKTGDKITVSAPAGTREYRIVKIT